MWFSLILVCRYRSVHFQRKLAKIGHTQSEKLQGIRQLGASEITSQTWQGEHAGTHEIQLIYNTTASPIQSKIQSVGADEFLQFIPDKMTQLSLWAICEHERKHQYVCDGDQ